jgi:hypothetical protein
VASRLRRHNNSHRRRARTPTCSGRLSPPCRYFQWTLFSANVRNYCVFVVILYSNCIGQPPLFLTAGPRQPETTAPRASIFPLGGFRPPTFQFATADIPSSSTPSIFQPAFDATTEDQPGWDQFGYNDILTTLDAPQQAEEVGPSQLTQSPVGTHPTYPLGGATLTAGGVTPDDAGSSQVAMATPSPDQL